jgi:hypothetical protein
MTTEDTNNSQVELNEEGQAVLERVELIEANEALLNDPDHREFYENYQKTFPQAEEEDGVVAVTEEEDGEETTGEEPTETTGEETTDTAVYKYGDEEFKTREELTTRVRDAYEKDDALLEVTIEGDDEAVKEIEAIGKKEEPATLEGIDDYVKNTLKLDTSTQEGRDKAAKIINGFRKDSEELQEVKDDLEIYKNNLAKLPDPLYNAVKAHMGGKSWREAIRNTPNIDFDKDVTDYTNKQLVEAFFPGRVDEDDWNTYSDDPNSTESKLVKELITLSKDKFATSKQEVNNERVNNANKSKQHIEDLKESVTGSVSYLKESLPDEDVASIKDVESIMNSGNLNKLLGLFVNSKGIFKKEAAKRIWHAKYGEDQVNKKEATIDKQSTETRKIVVNARKRPATETDKVPKARKEADDLGVLSFMTQKKTY